MRQLRYNQQGAGYFTGNRYQKGNGFFGRVIKNAIFPLLKYIGKQGIKTAVAIGEEAVRYPSDFKSIARKKLKEAGISAIDDGAERVKRFVQTGEGIKRKCEVIKGPKEKKLKLSVKAFKTEKPRPPVKISKTSESVRKAIKGKLKRKYKFLKKNGAPSY